MRLSRKNKVVFSLITVCLLIIVSWITGKSPQELLQLSPSPQPAVQGVQSNKQHLPKDKQEAKVIKVIDGDTITVDIKGTKEKVRILGINTPESVDPRRPVQCFGKEASNFAKQILTGQTVFLESDPSQSERDRYGRLLRFVWVNNGTVDYGTIVIGEGFAQEYTYEVPHKYQTTYKELQQIAQEKKKGLWSEDACAK